jgi:RNA polymerase sigma-70 factor (ECF subfamily)
MAEATPKDLFPLTRWSRVLAAGDPHNPERRADLDALARAYWVPIHAYLQRACGLQGDAAADLTQDFFVHAIQRGTVGKAAPERGRFRSFLKTALRNFAADHRRRAGAGKRGGGAVRGLDDAQPLASDDPAPDVALDDAWRAVLLERALAALERELVESGKQPYWEVFSSYFVAAEPDLDYAALAARHGIPVTSVSNWLRAGKQRFRQLLHDMVAETVGSSAALEQELAWLFRGVKM